jgi:hypothetical protein
VRGYPVPCASGFTGGYPDVEGLLVSNYAASPTVGHTTEAVPLVVPLTTMRQPDAGGSGADMGVYQINRATMLAQGSMVNGRNLRLQGKFARSGTLALTFKKTISVTTVSGADHNHFVYAAGDVNIADIGRFYTVTTIDGLPIGYDMGGTISAVDTGTNTATVIQRNQNYFNGNPPTPIVLVIGEDEPDAQYLPIVSCDTKNEEFAWGSLTPTGLTLSSSNAASTATCNVLILR